MTINSFVVIRMSEGGFFSKLKNKVAFKVNQAVEDPEAQKYAKEQAETKNKETLPRVKSIEEIRRERIEELRKDTRFSEKLDGLIKEITESVVKKYVAEGKSEKDANDQAGKYFLEKLTPMLNKELDNRSSSDTILSVLEDELEKVTDTSDPDTISPSRIAKKVWRYLKLIVEKGFIPFISIIISMYIANEMIIYPAPIRGIFFFITLIVCILYEPVALGLGLFYLAKSGYNYYVNEMTDKEKKRIMPTIFALLPITTYQPEGALESLFLYPFTYPKSKKDEEELPKIMKEYQDALDASFPYLEKIKTLPYVAEGLELIKKNIDTLHVPKEEKKPDEVPNEVPNVLEMNNETRKKFNNLTSTQLPPTISNTNKGVATSKESSNMTNQVVVPPFTNQSPTNLPPVMNNKEAISSSSNNKIAPNQSQLPVVNDKTISNQPVLPPVINTKTNSNQSVQPPTTNNKEEVLPPVINKETSSNQMVNTEQSNQDPTTKVENNPPLSP